MNFNYNFESTLLAISETMLDEKTEFYLNGYNAHFNSIGSGKGIELYYKPSTFKHSTDIKEEENANN